MRDDSPILDQRNHTHWPLAPGALQGIGLVDLANKPRPGRSCTRETARLQHASLTDAEHLIAQFDRLEELDAREIASLSSATSPRVTAAAA